MTPTPPTVKDGFTLNFESSPIANVAKVILGDIMGVGYVVDPRAQGTITLSSGRPIAKKDMLFVLENALHANNLVMMRDSAGFRIAPANEGASARSIAPRGERRRTRLRHDGRCRCIISRVRPWRGCSKVSPRGPARSAPTRAAIC